MTPARISLTIAGETRQVDLERSVVRLGAGGAEVPVEGVAQGQLHIWSAPPKVIRVGGPELFVDGQRVDEAPLELGSVAIWGPAQVVLESTGEPKVKAKPVLQELPAEPERRPAAARVDASGTRGVAAERASDRLLAGLLVEQGLADKDVARRWQASVVQGDWDADACAREVLERSAGATADPRILERAGRLQRDLVMSAFQQGMRKAVRSARGAARHGSAVLIANFVALLCYSLILIAIAFLLRVRWNWSFDQIIDRAIGVFK